MVQGWYWFVIPQMFAVAVWIAVKLFAGGTFGATISPGTALPSLDREPRKTPGIGESVVRFGISQFVGIIIVAIGMGSVLPVLNFVAAPFVCARGTAHFSMSRWSIPGKTTTYTDWFCIDHGMRTSDVGGTICLYAGVIYGVIIFGVWSLVVGLRPVWRRRVARRLRSATAEIVGRTVNRTDTDDAVAATTYRVQVRPDAGAPYQVSVDENWYDKLVDSQSNEVSWNDVGVGYRFRVQYHPRRPKRLYVFALPLGAEWERREHGPG